MIIYYKYKGIYNTKSNRLQNYDYSANGGYFITICTKNRENYFGEIIDGKMILNEYGKIVDDEIKNIGILRQNVILDEYVIMPNHLHLIIVLGDEINKCGDVLPGRDVLPKHLYFSKISPKQGTIGNIVKLFKGYTTKKINRLWDKTHIYFSWQANYYDRIIRDEEGLQRIRKYIVENPLKWEFDKNNAEDLFM